jgi:ribonucleoside-diphosphate reductase alpha chain
MSLNLTGYVKNPFTEKAEFDAPLFAEHVRKATQLIDDLVDIEIESIDRIIKKVELDPEDVATKANELALWHGVMDVCQKGRRTGLGITALGDCIAMLNHKYGDDNSIKDVEKIYSILRDEAYRQSVQLAKERGKFSLYDPQKEIGHPYLSRLPQDILTDMAKYGRRNMALLTTAPVGTRSNLVSSMGMRYGTTSGFEPLFMAKYTRRKKMHSNDPTKPDSVGKDGEKYKHYEVMHPGLANFIEITGKQFEDSPYFGAEANNIPRARRIAMQAIATKYICHSVSSTINLPKDIGLNDVSDIYMTAWSSGCKGITVYREGSREGILLSKEQGGCQNCDEAADNFKKLVKQGSRPGKIILSAAPKRPEIIECDIERIKVKDKQWVFLIGLLNEQPYEVFGGESEDIEIPKKFKKGWIVKDGVKSNRTMYDLVLGSLKNNGEGLRLVINNIAKAFSNYEHAAASRIVSLALRHGIPIKYICDQLTKDPEDDLFSYNRGLTRVLKKYIEEGEQSGLECPNCHAAKMVYRNGCPSCMVCGMSACT